MAGLSEHDRAQLRGIEDELAHDDPDLARTLLRFGRRIAPFRVRLLANAWLIVAGLGFVLGAAIAVLLVTLPA